MGAPSTIEIEQAFMSALQASDLFREVISAGRDKPEKPMSWPIASIYFDGDVDNTDSINPRPVPDMDFIVQIQNNNYESEEAAARDVYTLMDTVRDMFNGFNLDLDGIQAIRLIERRIVNYEAGLITYAMRFRVPVILEPIR